MKPLSATILTAFTVSAALGQGSLDWGANVPSDSTGLIEGNSALFRPFVNPSSRFQQVYTASEFVAPSAFGGVFLERVFFRVDTFQGFDFSGIGSNLHISLSTTMKQPDGLSPMFAENVGLNEMTVFGPVDRLVSGGYIPNGNFPQTYSVRIDFTTPFLYRPTDGNLLMDFRVNGGAAGILDAWDRVGDSVGSVYGGVNDPSGLTTTIGLVTHFEGTLVPEPTPFLLALVGAAIAFVFKRRKA